MDADFVSDDGSPLAIYLALPAGDVPGIVHDAVPRGASILELGSGPGRHTRVLASLGHAVTAVDDSPEMLAHITDAETALGDLFTLDLDRTFDVVLATSHLINTPGLAARHSLLAVAQHHLAVGGIVIVERYAPGWLLEAGEITIEAGPVSMTYLPGRLAGDVRSASVIYTLDEKSWRQEFESEDVDDVKLENAARQADLTIDRELDDSRRLVALRNAALTVDR